MSDPTVTDPQSRHRPSRRFARMIAAAVTMSAYGLSAGAGLAHADSVVTFTGPAGPVPVDTAFTYTVEIPNTGPDLRDQSTEVNITLSGAAATFTAAQPSQYWECELQTTSVYCFDTGNRGYPVTITLTVLPTAAGTVTAQAIAKSAYDGTPNGTGSISTKVGRSAFPFAGSSGS